MAGASGVFFLWRPPLATPGRRIAPMITAALESLFAADARALVGRDEAAAWSCSP